MEQDDLIERADALYSERASAQRFAEAFTRSELISLWVQCTEDIDIGFDDEVYDALEEKYGHFSGSNG